MKNFGQQSEILLQEYVSPGIELIIDGKKGCDTEALAEVLLKVSNLLLSNSHIKELDINPLIASEERLVAVDTLMILEQ